MGKRSRSKSRRQSGAAAAADDNGDGAAGKVKEQMVDGDGPHHQPEEDYVLDEDNNNVNSAAEEDAKEPSPITTISKSEKMWNTSQSVLASNLLPLLSRPQDLLTSLLLADTDNNNRDDGQSNKQQHAARQQLLSTSQQLFQYIEHLASMEETLKEIQKQKKLREFATNDEEEEKIAEEDEDDVEEESSENEEPCGLSGIPSLYTGQTEHEKEEEEDEVAVDAETIWGQVDLQNNALLSKLKRSIKKLGKRCASDEEGGKKKYGVDDQVRILNTGAMMGDDEDNSDEDDSDEEDEDEDMMSMGSAASDFGDEQNNEGSDGEEGGDSDEDSEARRIRERMEKAMADMSDDGSEDDEEGGDGNNEDDERQRRIKELAARAAALEAEAIDPDREDMRDGFFDLHEMEAFADEEEEMLPDDAYGEEVPEPEDDKKKGKKKTLPHLKDRMGGNDSDSEDDDEEGFDEDEDDDALVQRFEPTGVRRKKYRADDEVEALYKLYDEEQDGVDDSDDEGSEVDASNMSAADFFGKPDKKLIQSYKNKQKKGKKSKEKVEVPKPQKGLLDDDADSWDEHNFEEDGTDWKDRDDEDEEGEDGEDQNDSEEEEEEEEEGQEEEVENDEDEGNQKLSAHAIRSKRLEEQTLSIEQDMMAEKPWKMMGEAKGKDRGTDTLLDSTPEFEVAFKPPPILTEEHTTNIEELIKKRIIDEDWDDVVPRELPDIGLKRGGGDAPDVSQEKSKLGLGELYEREYLKKSTGYDRTADEKQTEEDAAKEEMKELFANLCSQLDALSNYHFAPRPVADEADVKNREDVPAIAMEEVLPLHVSQSRGVAPEEVYAGGKGRNSVLKGESEMDQAERKRVRAAKKGARRKERKQKHADEKLISKLQPGLGLNNPYEKRKLREELQMARASGRVVVASDNKAEWRDEAAADKEYQTSTKFFAKMQENVESVMRGNEDGGRDKKKRKGMAAGQGSSAYRL